MNLLPCFTQRRDLTCLMWLLRSNFSFLPSIMVQSFANFLPPHQNENLKAFVSKSSRRTEGREVGSLLSVKNYLGLHYFLYFTQWLVQKIGAILSSIEMQMKNSASATLSLVKVREIVNSFGFYFDFSLVDFLWKFPFSDWPLWFLVLILQYSIEKFAKYPSLHLTGIHGGGRQKRGWISFVRGV